MSKLNKEIKDDISGVRLCRFFGRRSFLLICIPLLVASIYFCIYKIKEFHYDWQSRNWPSTTATIIEVRYYGKDGDRQPYTYIKYRYSVGEVEYENDRISLHDQSVGKNSETFAREHPKGSKITVFYNPNNPAVAVLRKGTDILSWLGLFISFIFVILLTLLICLAYELHRQVSMVKQRDVYSIREYIKGKKAGEVCMEAVLQAANLPNSEILSLLVPVAHPNSLKMLRSYIEHKGTPQMREHLEILVLEKSAESPKLAKAKRILDKGFKSLPRLFILGVILLPILILVWAFFDAKDRYRNITDAIAWPSTTATILRVDAIKNKSEEDERIPILEYIYQVKTKEYQSNRITASCADSLYLESQGDVEAFKETYKPGTTHTVYYNPTHSSESYLIRPSEDDAFNNLVMAIILVPLSWLLALLLWIMHRKASKQKNNKSLVEIEGT